jgi:hypothetical protein
MEFIPLHAAAVWNFFDEYVQFEIPSREVSKLLLGNNYFSDLNKKLLQNILTF